MTFCRRVCCAGGHEGAAWSDPEDALEEMMLFREKTEENLEKSISLLEKMYVEKKKRNGSTNAGTCTSVVRAWWNDNRWPHQKTSTLHDVIARHVT